MAVKGSGLGAGPDGSRVDQTKFDARSGAAKRTQTKFPIKDTMKDQTSLSYAGPANPGTGPDADPADVMSPEPKGKTLHRQSQILFNRWGMKGAAPDMTDSAKTGKTLDANIGGKVLGEAILSGSSNLPAKGTALTDSGKAPSRS
jgi:hypothetical protein